MALIIFLKQHIVFSMFISCYVTNVKLYLIVFLTFIFRRFFMQLKKDEPSNTENLKLNDDGFFNTEQLKTKDDKFVSRISDQYSRTGNNTNYVGTVDYEYDEKIERNAFRLTEDDVKKAFAPTKQEQRKKKDRIFFISELLMYLIIGFYIFYISRCCFVDQIDLYITLKRSIPITLFLIIYLICDSIFIFAMGKKKGGLFIMALLFPFYPFYRKKVVFESNLGIIATILIFFSIIMIFVTFGNVRTKYANVMYWENKISRHYMVELMDQKLSTNKRMGTMLVARFNLESCDVTVKGNDVKMVITANGNIKIDDISSNDAKVIPTIMTFTKNKSENDFELTEVTLDGKKLNDNQILQFFTKLETNSR